MGRLLREVQRGDSPFAPRRAHGSGRRTDYYRRVAVVGKCAIAFLALGGSQEVDFAKQRSGSTGHEKRADYFRPFLFDVCTSNKIINRYVIIIGQDYSIG